MECFISFEENATSKFSRKLNFMVADFLEENTIKTNIEILDSVIETIFEQYGDVSGLENKAAAFDKLTGVWDMRSALMAMVSEMEDIQNFEVADFTEQKNNDGEYEE